jgi:proteic killer suppression protein
MIRSFNNKALAELWSRGVGRKIDPQMHARILRRLDALDEAKMPDAMSVPGFNFHVLKGHKPARYTVHVNGPWCITFELEGGNAVNVDLEQYH